MLAPLSCAILGLAAPGPATAEWSLLATPRLTAAPIAAHEPAPLLAAAHLELEGAARARRVEARSAPLGQPVFLQLLEEHLRVRNLRLDLRPQPEGLYARGEPAALAAARALVQELDRHAAALEIDLVVTIRAAGRPDRVLRRRVPSGGEAFFGERDVRSFVAGFDVQVAADAGQAEPRIGAALAGTGLHVRAARMAGGTRVHLDGLLDAAHVAAIERFDPKTPDLGLFDQPLVESVQIAFAGIVASGAALEVEIQDAPPLRGATRISIAATARPDAAAAEDAWALLDLSFAASRARALEPVDPGTRLSAAPGADEPPSPALSPSALATLLESERTGGEARGTRAPIYWSDALLLLPRADAARLEVARGLVRATEEARSTTARVALQCGALRASIPVAHGRPARVVAGTERPFVVDYALEVAPQIWMPTPIVERAFDGFCVELVPARGALSAIGFRSATAEVAVAERDAGTIGRLQLLRRTQTCAGPHALQEKPTALFEGEGTVQMTILGP